MHECMNCHQCGYRKHRIIVSSRVAYTALSPIHTADADATQMSSWVASAPLGGVNAPIGSCDPVYNFLCCWAIEVGDKWRHNDVIVEKLTNIDQNSRSQTARPYGVWSVSKLSTESVDSRRELVANCVHAADADATQLDSFVASAVFIGYRIFHRPISFWHRITDCEWCKNRRQKFVIFLALFF